MYIFSNYIKFPINFDIFIILYEMCKHEKALKMSKFFIEKWTYFRLFSIPSQFLLTQDITKVFHNFPTVLYRSNLNLPIFKTNSISFE